MINPAYLVIFYFHAKLPTKFRLWTYVLYMRLISNWQNNTQKLKLVLTEISINIAVQQTVTVTVTVTEALVLCPLLEDRGRITESIRILVPVDRMKQKCFQITTKRVRRMQQFQLRR